MIDVTVAAVSALANVLDDIAVQSDLEGSEPEAEDVAAGALAALAEDGWELVCHHRIIDDDGTAVNVIEHYFAQVAKAETDG